MLEIRTDIHLHSSVQRRICTTLAITRHPLLHFCRTEMYQKDEKTRNFGKFFIHP
jgi:hypothetical protein